MSYTTADLVRKHLATAGPVRETITNQPMVLSDDGYRRFFSGPVDPSTVTVKAIPGGAPQRTTDVFTGDLVILPSESLVPGSVIVADNTSLGYLYRENLDYVVAYDTGRVQLKDGGDLEPGSTVAIWFLPYIIYETDVDYALRSDPGEIKRLAGGAISSGQTVYIDYAPRYAELDEDLIRSAVLEANGLIERQIDPDASFGADPSLQAAATCAALAVLCRASSIRALGTGSADDRAATVWLKVAADYAARSEELLRSFRPAAPGPSRPAHS